MACSRDALVSMPLVLGVWCLLCPGGDQASVCFRCSMNTEDGAKLYDVCPHVSDSVRLLCQKGVIMSVPQLLRHEDCARLGKVVRPGEEGTRAA